MIKVCLAIIDNKRTWKDYFVISLMDLIEYTRKSGVEVELMYIIANSVEMMRNCTVLNCIQNDFTHYISLDSDMNYPKDTIIRLLEHNKDIVVPRLYRRNPPFTSVQAYKYKYPFWEDSNLLKEKNKGLVKVEVSGPPAMLIKSGVLKTIYENTGKVWFEREYSFNGQSKADNFKKVSISEISSDVKFCKLIKDYGFEIWVDTDFDIPHECNDYFVINGNLERKELKKQKDL